MFGELLMIKVGRVIRFVKVCKRRVEMGFRINR
jgi:hypothetical protein